MEQKNTIKFKDCYKLYNFFKSISENLFKETHLVLEDNQLKIRDMDMSRICIIDITFSESKYVTEIINNTEKKDLGMNLEDLFKMLKTRKKDKKKVELTFEDKKLIINKFNSKSNIIKTLNELEIETEDHPLENLSKIDYPNFVLIDKTILDDFFYEAGSYSDIIIVKFDKQGLHFLESGTIGKSDMLFEMDQLGNYKFNDIEIEKKESIESSYSLRYLELMKGFLPILDNSDKITIELKKDHPLKITIDFISISCQMVFYLAARVEEEDLNDDDDDYF